MRSGGQVKFIRISRRAQLLTLGSVAAALIGWGGITATMAIDGMALAQERAALAAKGQSVAKAAGKVADYRKSVDALAQDLEARQDFMDELYRTHFGSEDDDAAGQDLVGDAQDKSGSLTAKISMAPEAAPLMRLQERQRRFALLLTGAVENALNMPSVTAEEAKVMGPWVKLAGHLGSFIGQMTDEPIKAINILYDGSVAEMNLAALNCATIAGIMKRANPEVNMVSAPVIAEERGVKISTTNQHKSGAFDGYVKVTVVTDKRERSIAGTVFSDGKPRFIQIKGINIDAEIGEHMLYTSNEDMPGIIGTLGATMGENGVNIANFTLGRHDKGGEAIALLYVDDAVPGPVLDKLTATGMFRQVKPLAFDVA